MAGHPESTFNRRAAGRLFAGTLAATAFAASAGRAAATAAGPRTTGGLDHLVDAMTLEEKVGMLHGATDPASVGQAGYLPGVPRLGIPELRLSDGPAGVRVTRHATALPAPVALAATFSPALARRYGAVIGREGRALGVDVLLAPMTNLVRVPQAGRNFETFGEDPLLAGGLVAGEVRGVQGEGLIATVKHFAANNFENGRQTVSADIDERTLREIYLPAFEAAVDSGVGAVMAAYPRVNGVYAAENPHLLTEVLRRDWGFRGWVMSDWFATHSGVPAITAGLDMEMPFGLNFGGLVDAVRSGALDESVVDTAVRRILEQLRRFGLLGHPRPRPPLDAAAHARTARELAIAGAVLLRNHGGLLPLGHRDLRSLAVVGPTARRPLVGGGGSARVIPEYAESPLDALSRRAPGLAYAPGVDLDGEPVPASALSLERTETGGGTQPESQVDYTGADALPAGSAWTWTGTITAPETGEYDLRIQGSGGAVVGIQGGITVVLDGVQLGSVGALFGGNEHLIPTADGLRNAGAFVTLAAGEPHDIVVTATATPDGPMQVRLAWVTPARRREALDEAARVARAAKAVLLFAFNEGTEGQDRVDLSLPGHQDDLVDAVTAANRRTAVVLNTGDPVVMPWVERAAAILQLWYPGQEGAEATAVLVTGEADPGGRLPVSYPRRLEDSPTAPTERYPGVGGHAAYSEGVLVGYRHYDAAGIEPLFPFGHGLSYTSFRYRDLTVHKGHRGLSVSFVVENTGRRAGVEVPQVYLGAPANAPVPMAPRQLAGFDRIALRAGERRRVRVEVTERSLSYWSVDRGGWVVATGRREVAVGSSSRDLRLHTTVSVH